MFNKEIRNIFKTTENKDPLWDDLHNKRYNS